MCGAIVQPLLAMWSDLSSTPWGQRKSFIVSGAIGLSASLLAFADVIAYSQARLGYCRASETCHTAQVVATFLLLTMNVSASAVQMGLRALMIDGCAQYQQCEVNAWVGRLINAASVFCYSLAYTDLSRLLPWAGSTQLEILSRLGALFIGCTQVVTCLCAPEKRFRGRAVEHSMPPRRWKLRDCIDFGSMRPSKRMFMIHGVQFFSWFAWFPFLSYISRYVFFPSVSVFGLSVVLSFFFGFCLFLCTLAVTFTRNTVSADERGVVMWIS